MKDLMVLFIMMMPTLACVTGAVLLMAKGIDGWGWLLFVAIVLRVTSFKTN